MLSYLLGLLLELSLYENLGEFPYVALIMYKKMMMMMMIVLM